MPSVKALLLVVLIGVIGSAHAWNPSQCPQDCVRPLSFWVENRPDSVYWPDNSASNKFNCGPTWLEVIKSTEINSWTILARQYIAAKLNIISFSCIDELYIKETLLEALYLLSGNYCTVSNETLAAELKTSIAEFNNGYGEVATCICPTCPNDGGSYPEKECPSCPNCPNPPPFTCEEWIVKKCCEKPPVPPPTNCSGCTRTQGYWKTHPEAWTKNFTICNIPALAILQTPSKEGNAFIILARQYIAARLNVDVLHVCVNDYVSKTIEDAWKLLYNGDYTCGYAPEKGSDLREKFIMTSMTLDNFNNGRLGPKHCDDRSYDSTSRMTEFYVDALESSFAVDDADFSSAAAVVPALFCMLMALLAIVA